MHSEGSPPILQNSEPTTPAEQIEHIKNAWQAVVDTQLWPIVLDAKAEAKKIWLEKAVPLNRKDVTKLELDAVFAILIKARDNMNVEIELKKPNILPLLDPLGEELVEALRHRYAQIFIRLANNISYLDLDNMNEGARNRYLSATNAEESLDGDYLNRRGADEIFTKVVATKVEKPTLMYQVGDTDVREQFLHEIEAAQISILKNRYGISDINYGTYIPKKIIQLAPIRTTVPENFDVYAITDTHWKILKGAMDELIYNAIREILPTNKISNVDVSFSQDSSSYILKVSDNGPGILPENMPHILGTTFRAERGGTGKGLLEIRNSIKHFGGTIVPKSPDGAYATTFTVTIPKNLSIITLEDIRLFETEAKSV